MVGEDAAAKLTLAANAGGARREPKDLGEGMIFARAYRDSRRDLRTLTAGITTIISSNDQFNEGLCRATADLYMLASRTPEGIYPFAGIPWYSTVFGRDGIITAMMALWIDPKFARGVLRYLASTQARRSIRRPTPSPARSCTRPGAARWRCSARCRSATITARSTARRSS